MAKLLRATAAAALVTLALGDAEPVHQQAEAYTVGGSCIDADGIDGLTFVKQGVTRNGSPYFKAASTTGRGEKYLYYDVDCSGGSQEPMRWIFDTNKPDVTKPNDLDSDLACNYISSTDSTDASRPPSGKWRVLCDGAEEEHYLTLREGAAPANTGFLPKAGTRAVTWEGACALKSFLNGKVFEEVGATADGRPFFRAQGREEYLYFDADCDGVGSTSSARWVVDNGRPSTTAARDLDQDGKCDYHARLDDNSQRPPSFGSWRMYCGPAEGWVNVPVTLRESVVSTTRHMAVNSAQKQSVLAAVVVALAAAYAAAFHE